MIEAVAREIARLEAGIAVTKVEIDVITNEFDAFVSHHIAGTVDKKVLMRARSMLPRRCANTLSPRVEIGL